MSSKPVPRIFVVREHVIAPTLPTIFNKNCYSARCFAPPIEAAAAAQTTSKPLYVDGVLRVVATFHCISEVSLPASGSMESFGTSVYPSWPRDAQRTRTILQSIDEEVQRMEPGKVYSTSLARQAKDERGAAGTDCRSTESPVGESKEGGEVEH